MKRRSKIILGVSCTALFIALGFSQRAGDDDREETIHYTESGLGTRSVPVDESTMSTAREVESHSSELRTWTNTPGFEKDVFTFCRLRYVSAYWGGRRSMGSWITDFPDSDLNLSFRLQQMTSLK